jgi:ribonuclease HII
VAAFALPRNDFYQGLEALDEPVRDSKKIQEAQREKSFEFIQALSDCVFKIAKFLFLLLKKKTFIGHE